MAIFKTDFTAAQTGTVLVTASGEAVVQVQRILITAWAGLWFQLISDPGGSKESVLTPKLRITNGMLGNYDFNKCFALSTGAGKSLGITTAYQAATSDYGVMLWYEYVS